MGVRNLGELGPNLQKIMSRLMDVNKSQNLLKLLYYTDKDPLNNSNPNLTEEQVKKEIYEKLIKITPLVTERDNAKSVIVLKVERGSTAMDNNQFRNIFLSIEVFVPMNQWIIKNSNLRPFAILGEIQKSLDGLRINGLGQLDCGDFNLKMLTEEMTCYSLDFNIIEYD